MSDSAQTTTPTLPLPRKRSRLRRLALALLIFIGGAACGAGIAGAVIVRSLQHAVRHPEEAPARITARLARRLDLTEAQSEAVRRIIAGRQGALLEIRRDVQPRVEVELSSLESEIAGVLDDAQRAKWRALASNFRANWLPPVPTTAPAPN